MIGHRVFLQLLPKWTREQSFPNGARNLSDLSREIAWHSALQGLNAANVISRVVVKVGQRFGLPSGRARSSGLDLVHGKVVHGSVRQKLGLLNAQIAGGIVPITRKGREWRKFV